MSFISFDGNNSSMISSHAYGRKMAREAMTFGILAVASLVILLGAVPVSLVLGMFAIGRAKEAQKAGVDAGKGKILGQIAIAISTCSFLLMSGFIFLTLYALKF